MCLVIVLGVYVVLGWDGFSWLCLLKGLFYFLVVILVLYWLFGIFGEGVIVVFCLMVMVLVVNFVFMMICMDDMFVVVLLLFVLL